MTVFFLHILSEELISTAPKAASRTCRGLGKIYRAITYVSLIFIPSQCNSSSTSRVDENCLCRSVDFHMWRTYELRISPTKRISSLSVLPSSDQLRWRSKPSWLFICWKYFSCLSRSPYNSQVCIAVMSVRSATFGNLACLRSASSVSTLLILVYNTPMTVNILSISILVNRIWMSGCVHMPSVLMDGYLIDAFFFCWACYCLLLLNCIIYKLNLKQAIG